MELPSHPDSDDSARDQKPATGMSTGTVVVIAIGVVLLVVVILHLTGVVGPASH